MTSEQFKKDDENKARFLHRVTVMAPTKMLEAFIVRAKMEGVEPLPNGFIPIDKVVLGLMEAYGNGRLVIMPPDYKGKKEHGKGGADYVAEHSK